MIVVLQSWFRALWDFIKEAALFYWRLITNKAGLPRWLWIAMLISWLVILSSLIIQNVLK